MVASLVWREEGPTEDCNSLVEAGASRINLWVGGGERQSGGEGGGEVEDNEKNRCWVYTLRCILYVYELIKDISLTLWMCLSAGVVLSIVLLQLKAEKMRVCTQPWHSILTQLSHSPPSTQNLYYVPHSMVQAYMHVHGFNIPGTFWRILASLVSPSPPSFCLWSVHAQFVLPACHVQNEAYYTHNLIFQLMHTIILPCYTGPI